MNEAEFQKELGKRKASYRQENGWHIVENKYGNIISFGYGKLFFSKKRLARDVLWQI